jgi:hypothetical protein
LSAVARLLAFSEQYSDLKASQNFLSLQSQLERAENRIAVARRDYIKAKQTAPQGQCADAVRAGTGRGAAP